MPKPDRISINIHIDLKTQEQNQLQTFRFAPIYQRYQFVLGMLLLSMVIMMCLSLAATFWLWRAHIPILIFVGGLLFFLSICSYVAMKGVVRDLVRRPLGQVPLMVGDINLLFTPRGLRVRTGYLTSFIRWEAFTTIAMSSEQIILAGPATFQVILNNHEKLDQGEFDRVTALLRGVPSAA